MDTREIHTAPLIREIEALRAQLESARLREAALREALEQSRNLVDSCDGAGECEVCQATDAALSQPDASRDYLARVRREALEEAIHAIDAAFERDEDIAPQDVIRALADATCSDLRDGLLCKRTAGHAGDHRSGLVTWMNRDLSPNPQETNTSPGNVPGVDVTEEGGLEQDAIWTCKIGGPVPRPLPMGADSPMRTAAEQAFLALTGRESEFCFSGWGGKLDAVERDVVEERRATPNAKDETP